MAQRVAGAAVLGGGAFAAYYFQDQLFGGAPAVAPPKNKAFVFLKPHAVTDKVQSLVASGLQAKGIKILSEGDLPCEVIDEKKLIDQHYYAIASKATILKPDQLNVPTDKFKSSFGMEWDDALKQGVVFNAMDACKELGCDASELNKMWGDAKKAGKLVKFGGGFYCGEINRGRKKKPIFVFNAFFMSMRSNFTKPGEKIHWYDVEWDAKDLSWGDFRGKLLGETDPHKSPKDSLRGQVLSDWKNLGLKSEPNTGDNAVHASASPFEGLAERMNWLEVPCSKDDYCQRMLASGISEATIKAWSVDPQVKINTEGKKGSLFDALEDMDVTDCLAKSKTLSTY